MWRAEAIREHAKARDDADWWKIAYLCWRNAECHSVKKLTLKVGAFNPMIEQEPTLTEGERAEALRATGGAMKHLTWEEFKAIENARRK